ncbi:MAG: tetratricopeptide repeat protein [Bacillus sp. (in: Bacteria)]|nr:tetratricopeptide repeat protein [Bacillus sp. (in: firmicutes)]MCM1425730.1 tetratricopeptide repeat protein [Eubacterium sp.]
MKKVSTAALGMALMLVLAGCGAKEKTDNISLGMEAVQNLEYDTAMKYFNTALESGENERLICRGMGLAYMGLSQYEEAIAYLEKALHLSDGSLQDMDYDLNYYLATAYFKNGQTQDALHSYDAILALRPKEIEAYYLRGYVKLCNGDYESAKEDFDRTISLDAQNYDRLLQIYVALVDNGYKEAGKEYLQQVIADNEKSISNYDLGRIYYYLEDYENAKNYLSQVKISSDYEASLYLGRTYEALGDYNYASSIYNDYTLNDQSKAEIYNQLGLCRMQMGEYELALMAFQSAMNIEGNEMMQTLKFNEIVAYEYMEEYKTAAALMSDYLKSYPDDEAAQRENQFLKTR